MPTPFLEDRHSTEGMVDYGKNSAMQQRLVRHHAGRIGDLVRRLGLVEPELKIVDYGCGPGPSAIAAVAPAVEACRARFPRAPIAVCHADRLAEDFYHRLETLYRESPGKYAGEIWYLTVVMRRT